MKTFSCGYNFQIRYPPLVAVEDGAGQSILLNELDRAYWEKLPLGVCLIRNYCIRAENADRGEYYDAHRKRNAPIAREHRPELVESFPR